MGKNKKIEEIEAGELGIKAFIALEEVMRLEAERVDGVDEEEKKSLKNIKDKIDDFTAKIADLRKTFEENKAIWDGKAADFDAFKDKRDKLLTFAHRNAEAAVKAGVEIDQAVTDQRWADATTRLETANNDIAADWAEYETQTEAQSTFEPRFAKIEKRWQVAKAVETPSAEATEALRVFLIEIADVYAAVAKRDFVKALEESKDAKKRIGEIERLLKLPPPADLSGSTWYDANDSKFPKYYSLSDLESSFKSNVEAFQTALQAAGVSIAISGTKRDPPRALVMHYCWQVAKGAVAPDKVPAIAGVNIDFDHGDDAVSIAKAAEMVASYHIVHRPSKQSNHEIGKAIDWSLTWSGDLTIKNKAGEDVVISSSPKNGTNTDLHPVGASFGVHKLVGDAPHWSHNGN